MRFGWLLRYMVRSVTVPDFRCTAIAYSLPRAQAKFKPEEIDALSEVLGLDKSLVHDGCGAHWWPNRGLGPMPPTDPVLYRLYEVFE